MSGIGTIIDNKYELIRYINKGGMSDVYLAVNRRLGNYWAIKEIKKSNDRNNQIYIHSLIAEANLMKDLDHPAFPRIVDIIDTKECLYLVMDYIKGQTLEQVLSEYGAQDEKTVAGWGIELCRALSYLHNQNPPIIYRDMKPSNIIIKPDGTLKIIDFGTARVFNPQKPNDTIALGTRGFAPPEQYSGRTDARSDIYALGMTMKYLMTGVNPCMEYSSNAYEAGMISELMQRVVEKCIAVDPESRYQSCAELSNDLLLVFNSRKSKKPNSLIKIIVPAAATIVALIITLTVLAVNSLNNTGNKQSETEPSEATTAAASAAATSAANRNYAVPDTVGMEYEKALPLLLESGFTVESEEEFNDDAEYGIVIRQSIQAGEQFEKPQVITLVVSKGKEDSDSGKSEASPNSNDSPGNADANREDEDNDSGNTLNDNDDKEENSSNNGNTSGNDNSNNDSEHSIVDPPDQSSNDTDIDSGMNQEISNDDYELPFFPRDYRY